MYLNVLIIFVGSDNQGIKLAAATYLKNFTRRHVEGKPSTSDLHIEFRDQLAQALLQVEPAVLKVLNEAVCILISIFVFLSIFILMFQQNNVPSIFFFKKV